MHDILNDIETELGLLQDGRINDSHPPVELLKRAKAEIRHLRNLIRMGYEAENEAHNAINSLMADISKMEKRIHDYLNARTHKAWMSPEVAENEEKLYLAALANTVGRIIKK